MPKIVDHELRRKEISEIAAKLIAAGGLEAATFREVARSSGYSKGVIEHYFENKDALIGGALDWANYNYVRRVADSTKNLSGLAALRRRMEAILPLNKKVRDEWKVRMVFWSEAAINNSMRVGQAKRFELAVQMYGADLDRAAALGEIPSDSNSAELAERLFMGIIGACTLSLYNATRYGEAFLLTEIERLIGTLSESK
ncbi:MAG: TetR/AcrR family transcriptional regulator [Halioglobus sp.]